MKTLFKLKSIFVSSAIALVSIGGLTSCEKESEFTPEASYNIREASNGSQMVPATNATGSADIVGSYNPNTRLLTYTSSWNYLSGRPTAAGFYSGATGTSGTAVGENWSIASDATNSGNYMSSITLTKEQADKLIAGEMYYTYRTSNNPNGEVRGQITASR